MDKVFRFFITAIFALVGGILLHLATPALVLLVGTEVLKLHMGIYQLTLANVLFLLLGISLGGFLGYGLSPYFARKLQKFSLWVEIQLSKRPMNDVIAGVCGLAIGLIIANLLGTGFSNIPVVGSYIPVVFSIVFGYLGIHIVIRKQKDLAELLGNFPRLLRIPVSMKREAGESATMAEHGNKNKAVDCKLLDTSVIIDGRIADICRTGFLDGKLLIPVFVLEELQHIADSADALKRVRGRRGLDILQQIRNENAKQVEIVKHDFEDISQVDSKLIRLGQLLNAKIITNDYNLNKVAQLQGVSVLNINDLANAIKPIVVPGEYMQVTVVKAGKEAGQGLAYLDDGTMIVVEDGKKHINNDIKVEVTSALQTSAGRMIFARPIA